MRGLIQHLGIARELATEDLQEIDRIVGLVARHRAAQAGQPHLLFEIKILNASDALTQDWSGIRAAATRSKAEATLSGYPQIGGLRRSGSLAKAGVNSGGEQQDRKNKTPKHETNHKLKTLKSINKHLGRNKNGRRGCACHAHHSAAQ